MRSTLTPRGRLALHAALCLLFGACVGSLAAPGAHAADKFAAEFLKIGVGARALGMGGAFVSDADDATAAYWNPSGLTQLESREAFGMHASQFGGVENHDVLGFSTPIGARNSRSAIGVTLIRLAIDDIRITKDAKVGEDQNGNPILDPSLIRTSSASDLALLLSYATGLGERWSGGVNLKLVRQSLVDAGASFGIGADVGLRYQASGSLALGARLADITTTQLFWDSGRRETVSPTATLGGSTTRDIGALKGSLNLDLEAPLVFEGQEADQFQSGNLSGNWHPGLEYWFQKTVALRFGSDGGDFTAGAGLRYKQFGADYAYLAHDVLDATHRVSAQLRF